MISSGQRFVLRHRGGRYLQSDIYAPAFRAGDWLPTPSWRFSLVVSPFAATPVWQREHGERFLSSPEWLPVADQFEIVGSPCCQCCGYSDGSMWGDGENFRCDKHRDRNPCAIEGCKRTTAAHEGRLATDQYLCSEHWRALVPPRSRRRRIYHHYFRKGKRFGWSPELTRSFYRFWDRLVADARKRTTEGHIDEAEIGRLFGWESAA